MERLLMTNTQSQVKSPTQWGTLIWTINHQISEVTSVSHSDVQIDLCWSIVDLLCCRHSVSLWLAAVVCFYSLEHTEDFTDWERNHWWRRICVDRVGLYSSTALWIQTSAAKHQIQRMKRKVHELETLCFSQVTYTQLLADAGAKLLLGRPTMGIRQLAWQSINSNNQSTWT